jgi:hypothetical protein
VVDGERSALIVASDAYTDPGLRRLRAPAKDAQALAAVLRDPQIGGFQVRTLLNRPAHEVNLAVEEFFADRRPDDLLLLHFSCHGVKDEDGELYFATSNTLLRRLGATAVAADFVNRRMNRSRSRRVVLLLDCCYAGAFERGMTARAGTEVGIQERFGGRGRAVITASSAMEYAFEGDELADARASAPSVFTRALVQGLETGDADRDQDGMVALDELYDYVYDRVRAATPNQTPGKWMFGVQGDLYIARRARPVTTPAPLPAEFQQAVESPLTGVRAGAVHELQRLLGSRRAGLALVARQVLEQLTNDDSRTVATAATAALAAPAPTQPASRQAAAAATALTPPAQPAPAAAPRGPAATTPPAEGAAAPPTPTASTGGAHAGSGPEAAVAPTGIDQRPAPRVRTDRRLLAAGGLGIVCAALILLGLFAAYTDGYRLGSDHLPYWKAADNIWYAVIVAGLALTVGICAAAPYMRWLALVAGYERKQGYPDPPEDVAVRSWAGRDLDRRGPWGGHRPVRDRRGAPLRAGDGRRHLPGDAGVPSQPSRRGRTDKPRARAGGVPELPARRAPADAVHTRNALQAGPRPCNGSHDDASSRVARSEPQHGRAEGQSRRRELHKDGCVN